MNYVFLKFIFAFVIVYWLFQSGKLDFSLVSKSLDSGFSWLFCMTLLVVQMGVSSIRWRLLLNTHMSKPISYLKLIRLTWIGLFFNSFLPGAVMGDFIKLAYFRDVDNPKSKTFLIISILLDRILGLIALFGILGLFSLIFYDEIVLLSPKMKQLVHLNFMLFFCSLLLLGALFVPSKLQGQLINVLLRGLPFFGQRIGKILRQLWSLGKNRKVIFKCIALSLFLQSSNLLAFWVISSPFYKIDIPIHYLFAFIPLGFVAMAVPVSPAGLGVGHLIFETLYSFVGVDGGASFFNLYFICMILVNSVGGLFWIQSSVQKSASKSII